MVEWTSNTIMYWYDARVSGVNKFVKISDHGRSSLAESIERIENKQRMADGTLRRYSVAKKRSWSCSWDNLPSTNSVPGGYTTADGGWAGQDMEAFHIYQDDAFDMQLRRGSGEVETVKVMISDFSKEVVKRGMVDFWNLDITLDEV